ncbi:hypothetical protein jhhlp_007750 [Lomentospora prolificans]|uniref:N-acetyltransferase domain-containing protein n=1 Tax=Lomentospora prolificans TaxID=41688 RepID=A0A2N3N0F8_9PEZI|nr:hypothetical protein jhhlp_007750 [Lomentospora prolificans]
MSKQTHIVRKAMLSDAQAIADMAREVFVKTFGHSTSEENVNNYLKENYSTEAMAKHLQHPDHETLVAVDAGGRIRGYGTLRKNVREPCLDDVPDKIELLRLYVDASALGRGIGGSIARALEDLAREQGFKNMWLGVWEGNYNSQKVYEKWGYKRVGEHIFYLGDEAQTDWILLKALINDG